jgi:hypothetical protein
MILVFFTTHNNTFELNSTANESLLLALTIFVPLMFGVLSIVYSISQIKLTLEGFKKLKMFKANVQFVIVVSLLALAFSMLFSLNISSGFWYMNIIKFIIYALIFNIGLTILMIIKRFDYILNQIINNEIKKKL